MFTARVHTHTHTHTRHIIFWDTIVVTSPRQVPSIFTTSLYNLEIQRKNRLTFTCSKSTINTRKMHEMCSELTIKPPERRQ